MLYQVLSESLYFFRIHLISICLIVLPIVVPLELMDVLYRLFLMPDTPSVAHELILAGAELAAYPIYSVALVFFIAATLVNQPTKIQKLWRLGLRFWLPYMVLTIVVTLAVIFGLALLILPGFILMARFSFAEIELLLNGERPLTAINNSWRMSGGYTWTLFGGFFILVLALNGPMIFLSALFEDSDRLQLVVESASAVVFSVFESLFTIFAFFMYRLVKENQD